MKLDLILIRAIAIFLTALVSVTFPSPTIQIEAASQQQQPLPLQGKQKIILLGDSITQAGGKYGGYIWLMQRYLNALYSSPKIELINAGISGQTSQDLQERFQRDVLDEKPDLVTINVGVNDVIKSFKNSQVTVEIYRQNLNSMVKAAQARNISVLLLSPTIINEDLNSPENIKLAEYIATMKDIAQKNRCQYIDLNVPFRHVIMTYQRYGGRAQNLLTRDGVHPNLAGYQIMAYTILKGWGIPEQQIQDLEVIQY